MDVKKEQLVPVLVAVLLGLLFLQLVLSMRLHSATSDEVTHLPSGYTYLATGEVRMNAQHPPLIKLLAALPLLPLDPALDTRERARWDEPGFEWSFGRQFLFSNDADRILFRGRFPVVLLSIVLGIYVFVWSRDLFGPAGGLLSLLLHCFSPIVIAHGHLVTMDLGLACFFVVTLYHLRRFVRDGGWPHGVAAGIGTGLALATKFSAVILVLAVVVLVVWAAVRSRAATLPRLTPKRAAAFLAVTAVLASVVLYVVYLFPDDPLFYWNGLQKVNLDHLEYYQVYLFGQFTEGSFWYYFPAAFLIKTPLPVLLLLALSAFLVHRFPAGNDLEEAFLVVPAAIFTLVTCALADNIGIRYLLPVYPLLFIFVGRSAKFLLSTRIRRYAAVVLVVWLVAGAALIYPDHLAYFNELVGGPANGWKYLDDSNIDWGQDLKRLKGWMDDNGVEEVRLLTWQNLTPEYHGIRYRPLRSEELGGTPAPGVYAISTHLLIRGELRARLLGWKTDWLSRYEPIDRIGYSIYIFRF